MYLENIVFDAVNPQLVGLFWQDLLGSEQLTDSAEGFETRLTAPGGPTLDLCFQPVPEAPKGSARLHLAVLGGVETDSMVAAALGRGASGTGTGQGDVSRVVLEDPESNTFSVLRDGSAYLGTGTIASLALDSADPDRDAEFWSWLTGWNAMALHSRTLRHPTVAGPLLLLAQEPAAKVGPKSRMHLDLRLEADDDPDAVASEIGARGGRELHPNWGELPWRVYQDPSGNEFCVLPSN
ncbi:VOC family protein [Paeniglutamicibacter gangotriensis]|uniref:VOC family protein n=1 Tax=Paeniglutamicibacter gangotriensis TaxID=254787 RepID=UPI0037C8BB20